MARIDNLNLEISKQQFSLPDLISTIIQDFGKQIQGNKRNLELIYDDNNNTTTVSVLTGAEAGADEEEEEEKSCKDLIIKADKERIAQVIINLLDNAIKNTDSGKIITTVTITSANVANTETKSSNSERNNSQGKRFWQGYRSYVIYQNIFKILYRL